MSRDFDLEDKAQSGRRIGKSYMVVEEDTFDHECIALYFDFSYEVYARQEYAEKSNAIKIVGIYDLRPGGEYTDMRFRQFRNYILCNPSA